MSNNHISYINAPGLMMMMNSLSLLLEKFFMENRWKIIHSDQLGTYFIYWYKYVDDIICCFNRIQRKQESFQKLINSIHPRLNFTLKVKVDSQINLLDLTLTSQSNKHEFSRLHKSSYTDITIQSYLLYPYSHKLGAY